MSELNTQHLSAERQADVLERLKIEFRGVHTRNFGFLKRAIFEIRFKKLLKSNTLLEFLEERKRLYEEYPYYKSLEDMLTEPFIGLTKEELYAMGLDNQRIDKFYRLNYEELFAITQIIGKEKYEEVHAYRDEINKSK